MALSPMPAAVTGPFAVTMALVAALIPVPPPFAVKAASAPFVVTLAPLVAVTAVPKPTVTLPLTVQGAPPF
jgi:hypothetical protein